MVLGSARENGSVSSAREGAAQRAKGEQVAEAGRAPCGGARSKKKRSRAKPVHPQVGSGEGKERERREESAVSALA